MDSLFSDADRTACISWSIIGVAALLLALSVIVLARLRWIQSRPIRACIVLSVCAHVLLLFVFYFSRVFDLPFIPGGDHAIVVHLALEDMALPDETSPESEASLEPQETPPEPSEPIDLTPAPALSPLPEPEPQSDLEPPVEVDQPERDSALDAEPPPEPETFPDLQMALQAPPLDPAVTDPDQPPPAQEPAQAVQSELSNEQPTSEDDSSMADKSLDPQSGDVHALAEPNWRSAATRYRPPLRYRHRFEVSQDLLERRGGNPRTQAAVESALQWLARNQSEDGRWSAAAHGAGRGQWIEGQHRGTTGVSADTGITGLALLSFLGAGHTHRHGDFQDTVDRAIGFLVAQQNSRGSLGGQASIYAQMYCHGIATLSLCEALAMTGDDDLTAVAQRAIDYTVSTQHPQTGGWRYRPGDRGDTSQFGWQLMALISAREAGLQVPDPVGTRLQGFLHSVQRGKYQGLAAYRPGHAVSRSMTAEAMACRMFLDWHVAQQNNESADYIAALPPGRGQRNLYFWYYGTLALSQFESAHWRDWNRALQRELLPSQRDRGPLAGSWDPNTVWGGCGGRVYSTALSALCLESYYRYGVSR